MYKYSRNIQSMHINNRLPIRRLFNTHFTLNIESIFKNKTSNQYLGNETLRKAVIASVASIG